MPADTPSSALTAGSLPRRGFAALIDAAPVIAALGVQIWASITLPTINTADGQLADQEVIALFASATFIVINLWMIYLFLTTRLGRSLGKRLMGLRVVGQDGGRPTWRASFFREVFAKVTLPMVIVGLVLPPALIAVPLILMWPAFWREDRRALHDRVSKTLVVRDAPAGVEAAAADTV